MRGVAYAAVAGLGLAGTAGAQQVDLLIDQTVDLKGKEVGYVLELALTASSPTRIGVDAQLDLSDLQRQLPEILAGTTVLELCSMTVTVQKSETRARDRLVLVTGDVEVERFTCERTDPTTWQRGEVQASSVISVRAELSAELRDSCVVFQVHDLQPEFPEQLEKLGPVQLGTGRIQEAGDLMIEALDLVLEDTPFCPSLPAELEILDPQYQEGSTIEIGDGGLGVGLRGTIDVSAGTIVEVLKLLQERGVLPPAP